MRSWISCALLLLCFAAPASAEDYVVTPNGTDDHCDDDRPCSLAYAVGEATGNDTIFVRSGRHVPTGGVLTVTEPIEIRAKGSGSRPVIAGTVKIRGGGTLRGVAIEGSSAVDPALELKGSAAEDLMVTSTAGTSVTLVAHTARTTLRDTVVKGADDKVAIDMDGATVGEVALRNVTAVAGGTTNSSIAIHCGLTIGSAVLKNVIARGAGSDIEGGLGLCNVSHSAFNPAKSPALILGTGNVSAAPVFADAHYRPAAGSPTVDAGTGDALTGNKDPDGNARTLGAAVDIGAYEYVGTPTTSDPVSVPNPAEGSDPSPVLGMPRAPEGADPSPVLGMPRAPEPGESVTVRPESGTVVVKLPGGRGFVPVDQAGQIPVGATIDARMGAVRLVTARDDRGGVQAGTFSGGMFVVKQTGGRAPVTELWLAGGNFASCPKPSKRRGVVARAASKGKGRVVRRLWGRDRNGRFRTRGRDAAATVRGTRWLTEDRCDGTRIAVTEGAVSVRPLRGGKARLVRAGGSWLATRRPARGS